MNDDMNINNTFVTNDNLVQNQTSTQGQSLQPNNLSKKSKVGLVVLLMFFVGLLCAFGGYFGSRFIKDDTPVTSNDELDEIEEEKENDKIIPDKNVNYTFLKEVKDTINLGNNDVSVIAYYYIDTADLKNVGSEVISTYYLIRKEVFVEGDKVVDAHIISIYDDETDAKTDSTDKIFNNYAIFKDTVSDEYYLAIEYFDADDSIDFKTLDIYPGGPDDNYLVIDSKGKVQKVIPGDYWNTSLIEISVDPSEVGDRSSKDSALVSGKSAIYFDAIIDVHDNFIYYLKRLDNGKYEEYKLSFNNSEISENLIKTYNPDSLESAGATY